MDRYSILLKQDQRFFMIGAIETALGSLDGEALPSNHQIVQDLEIDDAKPSLANNQDQLSREKFPGQASDFYRSMIEFDRVWPERHLKEKVLPRLEAGMCQLDLVGEQLFTEQMLARFLQVTLVTAVSTGQIQYGLKVIKLLEDLKLMKHVETEGSA